MSKVADIGGGDGTLLLGLVRQVSHLEGIVFDLPDVVEIARRNVTEAGLASRVSCVGGSFFESALPAADAYVLARILHDWNDEEAMQILRAVHTAAPKGARLHVIDDVIAPGNGPQPAKILDLQMLIVGGKERTAEEWRELFDACGFSLVGVVPGVVARIDAVAR